MDQHQFDDLMARCEQAEAFVAAQPAIPGDLKCPVCLAQCEIAHPENNGACRYEGVHALTARAAKPAEPGKPDIEIFASLLMLSVCAAHPNNPDDEDDDKLDAIREGCFRWVIEHGEEVARYFGCEVADLKALMVMGQTVDVEDTGQRSYTRMVCRLSVVHGPAVTDVDRAMVAEGWAWSATQFEPVHDRDSAMPGIEAQARAAHLGIWASANPVPPWNWRHGGAQ